MLMNLCGVPIIFSLDGQIVCEISPVSCNGGTSLIKYSEVNSEGALSLRELLEWYEEQNKCFHILLVDQAIETLISIPDKRGSTYILVPTSATIENGAITCSGLVPCACAEALRRLIANKGKRAFPAPRGGRIAERIDSLVTGDRHARSRPTDFSIFDEHLGLIGAPIVLYEEHLAYYCYMLYAWITWLGGTIRPLSEGGLAMVMDLPYGKTNLIFLKSTGSFIDAVVALENETNIKFRVYDTVINQAEQVKLKFDYYPI